MINLPAKFNVSISTHYDDMKVIQNVEGWFGVIRVTQSH